MPYYITHNNLKIPYEDVGTGQVMLFIPGWTMSKRSFQKQLAALSKTWRVITLDLRGQGDSEKKDLETIDFTDWAQDIHDLLLQLDLKEVVLVGWSLGTLVMWLYCQQYNYDRVAGLVHIDMLAQLSGGWAEYKNTLINQDYREYLASFIEEMFMPTVSAKDQSFFLREAMKTPPILASSLLQVPRANNLQDTSANWPGTSRTKTKPWSTKWISFENTSIMLRKLSPCNRTTPKSLV